MQNSRVETVTDETFFTELEAAGLLSPSIETEELTSLLAKLVTFLTRGNRQLIKEVTTYNHSINFSNWLWLSEIAKELGKPVALMDKQMIVHQLLTGKRKIKIIKPKTK